MTKLKLKSINKTLVLTLYAWDEDIFSDIMIACITMHNMIVEDERESYIRYVDPTEFNDDRSRVRASTRTSIHEEEPFEYYNESSFDLDEYLATRATICNRTTHVSLKSDLIEHI
ncbi:hypothetical protein QQ045_018489 [Rhodiola kirilowii]